MSNQTEITRRDWDELNAEYGCERIRHADSRERLETAKCSLVRCQETCERLQAQLRESEAKCAEAIQIISRFVAALDDDRTNMVRCVVGDLGVDLEEDMRCVLSTSYGKGWHSPAEWDALVKDHDKEIGDFQERVRNIVIDLTGAPDDAIDGKGSDAGWEEFTLAEISQGIAFVIDQRDALASQCQQSRDHLERLLAALPHECEGLDLAMAALKARNFLESSTPPTDLVSAKELEPTKKMLRELQTALHSVGLHTVANDCGFEADRLERLKESQ